MIIRDIRADPEAMYYQLKTKSSYNKLALSCNHHEVCTVGIFDCPFHIKKEGFKKHENCKNITAKHWDDYWYVNYDHWN